MSTSYSIIGFESKRTGGVRRLEFVFDVKYSPEFNQIYLFCYTSEANTDARVAVIIEPSDQTELRVSFASQIVRPADVDTSSCVPILRLMPFNESVEWRFVDYLSLAVRRKLAQWFKQTFGYEAVPDYGAIKRPIDELFTLADEEEVVHYLFGDDLDLVGPRQPRRLCFLERFWRQCRSFFE